MPIKHLLYRFSFLSFLLLSSYFSTAQTKINPNNFDSELLCELIYKKVNQVRDSINLPPLSSDNTLKVAAQKHADFQNKNNKPTHYQPKEKTKTPYNRVKAEGGKHEIILENIAFYNAPSTVQTKSSKEIKIVTYEDLATAFIRGWTKTLGNNKNIIDPRVEVTGIAVSYNKSLKRAYATQVFGSLQSSSSTGLISKNYYNIKPPNEQTNKKCKHCYEVLRQKPADVQYGVHVYDGELFFVMTDQEWFSKLFQDKNDGIAIDIISRSSFKCGYQNKLANTPVHRGYLLQPVYYNEIKKNAQIDDAGNVWCALGKLPKNFDKEELEFNLLLLQNKEVCLYQPFFDIPFSPWDILATELFSDTINSSQNEFSTTYKKTLKFTIPFQQNQTDFTTESIQPLYDSLKLTNYQITNARVHTYASVEGSTEKNYALQNKRANSIIKALQNLQGDSISPVINTSENWVEFYNDIKNTPYKNLEQKSKSEIKIALTDSKTFTDLSPYLNKHRKAIIELDLVLKTNTKLDSPENAIKLFNQAIKNKDISSALIIQRSIYNGSKEQKNFTNTTNQLNIPTEKEFSLLLNNQVTIPYQMGQIDLFQALLQFEKLNKAIPNNREILYNLTTLQLKAWALKKLVSPIKQVSSNITSLKTLNIPNELYTRLRINYEILNCEQLIQQRKYKEKEMALRYIFSNFKKLSLEQSDLLNLAGYLTNYNKSDWARQMLAPEIEKIDVSEDLLFYYINLTITNDKLTRKTAYRNIMLNAANINRDRFCELFGTYGKGGITFQLLDNRYLKKSYCEFCE